MLVGGGLALVAGVAVALGLWLAFGDQRRFVRVTDGGQGGVRTGRCSRWPLVVGAGIVVVLLSGTWLPLAVAAVAVVLTGVHQWRQWHAVQRRRTGAQQVARGCQVLAAQLRIGQVPVAALSAAAQECGALGPAVAAEQVGGSVAGALETAAARAEPGSRVGLAALAAAWRLAAQVGVGMAQAAEQVASHLAGLEAARRLVDSELTPARATGKMLAALPLLGIAMAAMVGGHPGAFLLGRTLGRWLLAVAVVLACVGIAWTDRLADQVERAIQ